MLNLEVIENAEINKIQVVDISGKTIISIDNPKNKSNNYNIPVGNLVEGPYVIVINSDDKVTHHKFIKK